jgi:hypothetical protein
MPNANYSVAITPITSGDTGGFTDDKYHYFDVSSKTTSGFTITFRQADNGNAGNVSSAVPLDWIAIANN